MDLFAPKKTGRLILSIIMVCISLGLFYYTHQLDVKAYQEIAVALIGVAIVLLIGAVVAFFAYFSRPILLHADEEGILTMYMFPLPWKYVKKIFVSDDFFVEIKLHDDDAFLAELDPDLYAAYYDEMELGQMHGHELIYFPIGATGIDCQTACDFLKEAQKTYSK